MKFKSDSQRKAVFSKFSRFNMMSHSPLDIAMRKYDKDKIVKLGSGSDRRVYALDEDNVIKVVKNRRGLEQNVLEGDAGTHMTPDVSHNGEDYVVVERADIDVPRTRKILQPLKDAPYHMDQWKRRDALMNAASKIDEEHGTDLQNIIGSYDPVINDMLREKNWGWKNDELKLIDAGILSDNYLKKKKIGDYNYKPDYDAYYHDLSDWRNILYDRSVARKEGRLDLSQKPQSKFSNDNIDEAEKQLELNKKNNTISDKEYNDMKKLLESFKKKSEFSSLGGMYDDSYYPDDGSEFSKNKPYVGLLPGNKVQTSVSDFVDRDEYDVDKVPQDILDKMGMTKYELLDMFRKGQLAIAPKGTNIKFD